MQERPHAATFGRLGRKVAAPTDDDRAWAAPPIPDLIAAIDTALKRHGRG